LDYAARKGLLTSFQLNKSINILNEHPVPNPWQTKSTDRFVLKWIKCHLSARITPRLVRVKWLRPWMITISSAFIGIVGGVVFALGLGWLAGLIAAASQILGGVDGQFARLTKMQSASGAFLDSVLDRYVDGAMVIGLILYLIRLPIPIPPWQLLILGSLALIGSNLMSYSMARAQSLGIQLDRPTLANNLVNKGTRTTVIVLCCFGTLFWPPMPMVALCYLSFYINLEVVRRLFRASRLSPIHPERADSKNAS